MAVTKITTAADPALDTLCRKLAALAQETDQAERWPAEQLRLCGEYGVFEWFLESPWGGQGWSTEEVTLGYLALSRACLTTTFILTQRAGACRRIASSSNQTLKELLLPPLASGASFATLGISHLTTSRRHIARPALRAQRVAGGYVLDGFSPWVTGALHAEHVVVGATLMERDQPSDRQLLVALPTNLAGVTAPPPARLVGVSASATGEFRCDQVEVAERWVLAGPAENVMSLGSGGGTGGHQTSTLAVGLAQAAVDYLASESAQRAELGAPLGALQGELAGVRDLLLAVVRGESDCSSELLRRQANSLVLRATQAALAAAKGAGFVVGHPAGRWCREALFFLVWSCPQAVVSANLCDLAGIAE